MAPACGLGHVRDTSKSCTLPGAKCLKFPSIFKLQEPLDGAHCEPYLAEEIKGRRLFPGRRTPIRDLRVGGRSFVTKS